MPKVSVIITCFNLQEYISRAISSCLNQTLDEKEFVGYAKKDEPEKVIFYITLPFDGGKASFGNGTMVAFKVLSQQIVDKVHELAIKNGGRRCSRRFKAKIL